MSSVLVIIIVLIAVVLVLAATRPATFRVERSTLIAAPPEAIFPLIDDFHSWGTWSPWERIDPALERTFDGAASGTGAVYAWQGNRKVGSGRMEITESMPPTRISINLDFLKPFEAHNVAQFTLQPEGTATRVIWSMHGPNTFMGKVMSVFVSMDRMIGKDFESGLANLKGAAER